MAEDDRALLRRAQLGDSVALEEVCRREWRPVYGLLYQAVGNRVDAQDMTQEVFLRALKSIDRYQTTGAPFRAYLATIARNLLRDRWRRKFPPFVDINEAAELPSQGAGPEEHVLTTVEAERLRHWIGTLPADYQTVIRLRILEGRPTDEVARLMNRNAAAVRQLQHRAIVALRNRMLEESVR